MFELLEDPPSRRCMLCALGNVLGSLLVFIVGWVLVGALLKVCARLFFLGWDLV